MADFHRILTPEQFSALPNTPPNAESIVKLTSEIDKSGKNRTLRRCGAFFEPLLESIQLYRDVADTLVSSNPQIAALVWGSVKIVIIVCVPCSYTWFGVIRVQCAKHASYQAAHNLSRTFEKLAEMFQTIGCLTPILKEFQELFPESPGLRESLVEFYAVVVEFSTGALQFLNKKCRNFLSCWISLVIFTPLICSGVDVFW